jgi:transcriptional regulator with XRE-family HTH domain
MSNAFKSGGFGDCLLGLRRSRNLSQKALSIMAGMDQSYVAGLETGRRSPPKEKQICRLIQALETTPVEEQELRAAHAISKMIDATDGLTTEQGKTLSALTQHLQCLSLDDIKTIENLASVLHRKAPLTNLDNRNFSMT